jgi:hypothetical protein
MYILRSLVVLLAINAQSNQDFVELKNALKEYIMETPERRAPLLVRLSFHDLAALTNDNGMGPNGCILAKEIQDIPENAGLSAEINNLVGLVNEKFPTKKFTMGDVISLSGKTAVEVAYPCIQIEWKYGRSECKSIANAGEIPPGNITSIQQLQPFLDRYGLSRSEMAILIAGAHGIQGARAHLENTGFGTANTIIPFANINSGVDWIIRTIGPWALHESPNSNPQFVFADSILRIPADFLFFPIVLNTIGKTLFVGDSEANPIEREMQLYANADRSVFDSDFARVYAKMLEIGTTEEHLTPFNDPDIPIAKCPRFYSFPKTPPNSPLEQLPTIFSNKSTVTVAIMPSKVPKNSELKTSFPLILLFIIALI